ncbi:MAG: hypothetical protein KDI13_01075 [Alphaproteobacteria bacterium]|nr:hypothetical protein [Alphaproteobacteria bacterium]
MLLAISFMEKAISAVLEPHRKRKAIDGFFKSLLEDDEKQKEAEIVEIYIEARKKQIAESARGPSVKGLRQEPTMQTFLLAECQKKDGKYNPVDVSIYILSLNDWIKEAIEDRAKVRYDAEIAKMVEKNRSPKDGPFP